MDLEMCHISFLLNASERASLGGLDLGGMQDQIGMPPCTAVI